MRNQILPTEREISTKAVSHRFESAGIVVLILYVIAGAIYGASLPTAPRFTDERDYLSLSEHLVHGPGFSLDGVHLTASRPPGFALFLAMIHAVGGGVVTYRLVQYLLLGATVVLASRLGSDSGAGPRLLIATGLVICYPVLFYIGGTLYPQTFAGFLFVLACGLMLRTPRSERVVVLSGIVFGLLILAVPTFLLTLVVVLALARYFQILNWRDLAMTAVVASLVVGAWTVRNAVCFDRFIPIATNSGLNLLEGNNENATPLAAANVGMAPYYAEAARRGLDEFQSDTYFRTEALRWIEANPGRALILYFEKAANFFNIINVYSPQIETEVPWWKQVALAAGYLLLLGLLLWRLTDIKRFPLLPREKLFLAVYILSAFTSAIFFTRIRHRLPYDYLLIAIVVQDIARRIEAFLDSRGRDRGDS